MSIFLLLIVAVVILLIVIARKRGRGVDHMPSDAPLGSRTSKIAETIALAAVGGTLLTMMATWTGIGGLVLDLSDQPRRIAVWTIAAAVVALAGYLLSLFLSWRGIGSVAFVVMFGTTISFAVALNGPIRSLARDRQQSSAEKRNDVKLTIDISGSNVTGADLWANDVYLGKTPVRMNLSEFLAKVPEWTEPPGPRRPVGSTTGMFDDRNVAVSPVPRDVHWGFVSLPEARGLKLAEGLNNELVRRTGQYVYYRAEIDGEPGERIGSNGGGGGFANYAINIGFRFPKREAAIERLLDQARLVDYQVSDAWLKAAADFGPDAWIAIRQAAMNEPEMESVFDAWVNRQYQVADVRGFGGAWQKFRQIMSEADTLGYYLTAAPAGRAVEMLSPQLLANELVKAAEPLIHSSTNISCSYYLDLFGKAHAGVQLPGVIGLKLSKRATGGFGFSTSGVDEPFPPSGIPLAHAIWLADRRDREQALSAAKPNLFETELSPEILRTMQRNSSGSLRIATLLGGPVVEKFLFRKVNATRGVDLQSSYRDQENGSSNVNRWLYWGAQIDSPAGEQFREQHVEEIFTMADSVVEPLPPRDNVGEKLRFMFMENAKGAESIGVKYWPRFGVNLQSHNRLGNQVPYLIALEPASTVDMYVEAWTDAWKELKHNADIVEPLKQLRVLPPEKRAAILDRLIESLPPAKQPTDLSTTEYTQREFRIARYDEIDDATSVEFFMKRLRDMPTQSRMYEQREQRERFNAELVKTASQRPLLVAALATAEKPELRLLAAPAMREHPSAKNRQLLAALLEDADEKVRLAAKDVAARYDELRAAMPKP